MTHFANQYIGLPWAVGGNGPDSFDCWGLVRWVQLQHYGRTLEIIPVDASNLKQVLTAFKSSNNYKHWQETDTLEDSNAVVLKQAKFPVHVGVWLDVDGGGLLHCLQGTGVVFQKLKDLQLAGWQIAHIYRYKQ